MLAAEARVDGILISNHGGELAQRFPLLSRDRNDYRPSA